MLNKPLLFTVLSGAIVGSSIFPSFVGAQSLDNDSIISNNENVIEVVENNDNFYTNYDMPDLDELSNLKVKIKDTLEYKTLTHKEALSYNPLHFVNTKRNSLILDAIEKEKNGDPDAWLEYRKFSYKQAPYNFEIVDGKPVYNKFYYGTLIESSIRNIKENRNNKDLLEVLTYNLLDRIKSFRDAPGLVPYVVGLNHNEDLAKQYNVPECDFDVWTNPMIEWNENKRMWFENPIFEDQPELLEHVLKYNTDAVIK